MKPSQALPHERLIIDSLFTALIAFLILFFGILSSGFFHTLFASADMSFAVFLKQFQIPIGAQFFLFFTYLGNWEVVFSIQAVVTLILLIAHHRRDLLLFTSAVFFGEALAVFFKLVAARPRPLGGLLGLEGADSFPSFHAMIAVLFYGLLAYLLLGLIKRPFYRKFIQVVTPILMFLIGFSRLYLGVHWLSDVIAGFALGGVLLMLFILFLERSKAIHAVDVVETSHPVRFAHMFSLILIVLEIFFIGFFYLSHPIIFH